MNKIKLTNSTKEVLIDDSMFLLLSDKSWRLHRDGYAVFTLNTKSKENIRHQKQKLIYMHHLIMGRKKGYVVDHINRNTLDNRMVNLRFCTLEENLLNRPAHKNNFLGIKGVKKTKYGTYEANIAYKGKRIHLGTHKTKLLAAKAYNEKAKELFGKFAYMNDLTTISH